MAGRQSSAVDLALKLLQKGQLTPTQICEKTGIAVSSLYRAAKKAGIPLAKPK